VPTVKIIGPYRFHFYASDQPEPRHVHVERDRARAKFWLEPVRPENNHGFSPPELLRIEKLVIRYQGEFRKKWDEYFNPQ
jgi:hypothetical protein